MNIKECIQIIKEEVNDPYCMSYVDALPDVIEEGMNGLICQMRYILSNLGNWRGEKSREVKKYIKKWIKENEAR